MTPTYHQDSPPSPKAQAPSSSSLSSYVFTCPSQDYGGIFHPREEHQLNYQQEAPNLASQDRSNDHQTPKSESDHGLKSAPCKKENGSHKNHGDQHGSAERVPTKKRFILKMIKSDSGRADREAPIKDPQMKFEEEKLQASSSSSNYCNIPIRVCSDCNTTKTPLWRSGPRGPKSLCNACGIRQRRARRDMAAAAASALNGTAILGAPETPLLKTEVQNKEKRTSKSSHVSKHKKRSKIGHTTTSHGKKKKICFEEFLISLSKNLAFHRVFPQDEKEAAILLMALSSGLLHG